MIQDLVNRLAIRAGKNRETPDQSCLSKASGVTLRQTGAADPPMPTVPPPTVPTKNVLTKNVLTKNVLTKNVLTKNRPNAKHPDPESFRDRGVGTS